MRAVVQRVTSASVSIEGVVHGAIGRGFMVLLGVGQGDTEKDARYLADKIAALRVFNDDAGKMNLALADVGGAMLIVSQFTLYGECHKGRRPSFINAAPPEPGAELYETFIAFVREKGLQVETGKFGGDMQVSLVNDGPVTLLLESSKQF